MEKSSFFNSIDGDRTYEARDFAEYFSRLVTNGIFPDPSNNLYVTANDSFEISVAEGAAYINGYLYTNTAEKTLTIKQPDGMQDRKDLVVVRLNHREREITVIVKEGTGATSPKPPNVTRTEDYYDLALAEITVKKAAIRITQSDILDTRLDTERCGIVNSLIQADTTEIFTNYEDWYNTKTNEWESEWKEWFENIQIDTIDHTHPDYENRLDDLETGKFENNLQIKKSIPSMILDAGRDGLTRLEWNATPTVDYGLRFVVDGVLVGAFYKNGELRRYDGENFHKYVDVKTLHEETTSFQVRTTRTSIPIGHTWEKFDFTNTLYRNHPRGLGLTSTADDTFKAPEKGVYQFTFKVHLKGVRDGTVAQTAICDGVGSDILVMLSSDIFAATGNPIIGGTAHVMLEKDQSVNFRTYVVGGGYDGEIENNEVNTYIQGHSIQFLD